MHIRPYQLQKEKREMNITERRRNGGWMALNGHWNVPAIKSTEWWLKFTEWPLSVFREWWRFVLWRILITSLQVWEVTAAGIDLHLLRPPPPQKKKKKISFFRLSINESLTYLKNATNPCSNISKRNDIPKKFFLFRVYMKFYKSPESTGSCISI